MGRYPCTGPASSRAPAPRSAPHRFGYLDVGGGGDFSVVIRSAFKWGGENWKVGAGGAVTALSEPQAEWEEMLAKRENVLRAFEYARCS